MKSLFTAKCTTALTSQVSNQSPARSAITPARNARKSIVAATGVLLMSLGAMTPPAHADSFAVGSDTNINISITSEKNWTTLRSLVVASSPQIRNCMVVASADLENPGLNAGNQTYHFTISLDDSSPPQNANGVEKTVELRDNSTIDDMSRFPVSTNARISLPANASHTIYFVGIKGGKDAADLVVQGRVLTMVCV
jgi:hypothetical protein